MAAADTHLLYDSEDLELWRASYDCYTDVIKELSAQKSKKNTKTKKESLLELDKWYRNDLPGLISSRNEPHMKHEELCKLMQWKLARGKFRPRLTELVKENSPVKVEEVTRVAISLPKLESAIEHICQLRGVGPATASAVLCAAAPHRAPFMADEVVLAVPGLGRLDYTLKHYLLYAEKIREKVKQLNKLGKADGGSQKMNWTPHDVELALWSHHFALKLKPGLLNGATTRGADGIVRKRTSNDSDYSSSEDVPKTKKTKR